LAIVTVLKVFGGVSCADLQAGFLFSGRVGSGLVIARLPDGCSTILVRH
jgi:lipid-binding SYLF domain-containing protein